MSDALVLTTFFLAIVAIAWVIKKQSDKVRKQMLDEMKDDEN